MFSQNEVFVFILISLAIYIGLSVLWKRALDAVEMAGYSSFKMDFSLNRADRIFGYTCDEISDGIWCQVIISLWRNRKSREFFIVKTYEYNKNKSIQQFAYVDRWQAKKIIEDFAPKSVSKDLVADWVDRTNRAI